MFSILRRHQRALYLVVTVVIIVSFAFFGTYSVFVSNTPPDQVAFTAIDGSAVYQSELRDMVAFISSDATDERNFMQPTTYNGLNDGVVDQDIFANGLAFSVLQPFIPRFEKEFSLKSVRERQYVSYKHPHASYISQEMMWNYFAPKIKQNMERLSTYTNPLQEESWQARVDLYRAEREFPAMYVKQLIRYQESRDSSMGVDEQLPSRDLSLFGYHSMKDWFSEEYIEVIAQYILNVAKYAQQKGVHVSSEEALTALYKNAAHVVSDSLFVQYFGKISPEDYVQSSVRRLGMDVSRAVSVWQYVLTFRLFFQELQNAILVDGQMFRDFYHHMNEFVDVTAYMLPNELRFRSLDDIWKYELYKRAVISNEKKLDDIDFFKNDFVNEKPVAEVKAIAPELIRRPFVLQYTVVKRDDIEGKIGLKKIWQWQVEDPHWQMLQEQFPELIKVDGATVEERQHALDALDEVRRTAVDMFSRHAIFDAHPEKVDEALGAVAPRTEELNLSEKGGLFPFAGITDKTAFLELLDTEPVGTESQQLCRYSQDGVYFYKIQILQRGDESIISYADAALDGTLNSMLNAILDLTYHKVRQEHPVPYLTDTGEWKPLNSVRNEMSHICFKEEIAKLDKKAQELQQQAPQLISWQDPDQARVVCFLFDMMQKSRAYIQEHVGENIETPLVKKELQVIRGRPNGEVDVDVAFSIHDGDWSTVQYSPTAGLLFYQVNKRGYLNSDVLLYGKALEMQSLLGKGLIHTKTSDLIRLMVDKKAFCENEDTQTEIESSLKSSGKG